MSIKEKINKLTPGQTWQILISGSLSIIYLLGLTTLLFLDYISMTYIQENIIPLIYLGVVFILIAPVYRQSEHVLDKIIKQVGIYSTTLFLMSIGIWLGTTSGFLTPDGWLELIVFDVANLIAKFGFFPALTFLLLGQVNWEEIFDRNTG